MARVVSFFKVIRNNWKKSVVITAAFYYGVSKGMVKYDTVQIMREYCEEAAKYGDQPISTKLKPQHVTVILNPVSNKKKGKQLFEEYCTPLLHLAGFAVTIIQTECENQARNLVANLNTHTDAILVAGGDGTLSDVVTGIMRKYKYNSSAAKLCPIGILPIGQTNRVANSLFHEYDDLKEFRGLIDATMAVIKGKTKLADVVQVELLEKDTEHPQEPIYALGAVEWGAWKDAQTRTSKYWYWGSLNRYATYIFNGYKTDINWDCNGIIRYSDPCSGCSKCYKEHKEASASGKRWWHVFVPKVKNFSSGESNVDYSKIVNENCGVIREIPINTTELNIVTQNVTSKDASTPSIKIELGPERVNYTEFVSEGWRRLKGNKTVNKIVEAKNIEIHPQKSDNFVDKERTFYIDNEEFEVKPVKFQLIPQAVRVFCAADQDIK